ncbi:MAG: biotin/lipoyl-containing protein [Bacillota bacterium]|nr:biotin/lipoyl-containing protein [Bacillota bacterium]
MDTEKIRQILEMFDKSKVSFMDLEIGEMKIKLEKNVLPVSVQETPAPIKDVVSNVETKTINSPIVGTFYEAVKPGEKPFVSVGQRINKGDVVCIVEAMKAMNEIRSDQEGTVLEILVKDGDMVEYEQPMFVLGD